MAMFKIIKVCSFSSSDPFIWGSKGAESGLEDAGSKFLLQGVIVGSNEGSPRLPRPLDNIQLHGTTTLAFKYGDGVIIAVDSRASVGSYVGSRTVKKVFPLSGRVVATMAGGAADCAHWIRRTARRARIFEEDFACHLPVAAVAYMLAASLRESRGSDLSIGTMVAGVDCDKDTHVTQPTLFYVDNEANCVSGDYFCVGSGSALAYAVLDSAKVEQDSTSCQECPKGALFAPSLDAAVDLALRAIRQATYRDAFSGGYINVLHVNATGIHHLVRMDSREMHLKPTV